MKEFVFDHTKKKRYLIPADKPMIYTPPNKKNNNNYYFFIKNHKTRRIWRYHKLVAIHNECYPQGLGTRPALRA